jgi:hypothetical protein
MVENPYQSPQAVDRPSHRPPGGPPPAKWLFAPFLITVVLAIATVIVFGLGPYLVVAAVGLSVVALVLLARGRTPPKVQE